MPWSPDRNTLLSKKGKAGWIGFQFFRSATYGNFLTGSWPISSHHFMESIAWHGRSRLLDIKTLPVARVLYSLSFFSADYHSGSGIYCTYYNHTIPSMPSCCQHHSIYQGNCDRLNLVVILMNTRSTTARASWTTDGEREREQKKVGTDWERERERESEKGETVPWSSVSPPQRV